MNLYLKATKEELEKALGLRKSLAVQGDDTEYDVLVHEECHHICSGNCRREGCNCLCGEFHYHD